MQFKNKVQLILTLIICLVFLSFTISCCDNRDDVEKVALAYAEDISSENWIEIFKDKYGYDDEGIKWKQGFRDAFPDYKVTVKRILVDGSDVILWNEISGTHSKEYPYGELKGIAPTNKKVTWTEIWYFNVVDGKRGEKWDMVIDGLSRLNQLKSE